MTSLGGVGGGTNPAGERVFTVQLHAGLPREGIWCDGCRTWARYEVDALTMSEAGVTRAATVSGRFGWGVR